MLGMTMRGGMEREREFAERYERMNGGDLMMFGMEYGTLMDAGESALRA